MKKKLMMMALVAATAFSIRPVQVQAEEFVFADEGTTESWSWAKSKIYRAYERGIVTGKEGNIFDADGLITRAEAATMLVRKKEIDPEKYDYPCTAFNDVGEEWYTNFVNAAYENGLMSGKGERLFDPNSYLTRAEAATMLVNEYKFTIDAPDTAFTDIAGQWYTPYVNLAYAHHYVRGVGDGLYEPERNTTRAEYIAMLLFSRPEDPNVKKYEYDEQGKTIFSWDQYGKTGEYFYDETGKLVQLKQYSPYDETSGILQYIVDYSYDENGRLVLEQEVSAETGNLSDYKKYTYDESGSLVSMRNGNWEEIYDQDGNMMKRISYDADDNIRSIREYSYIWSEDGRQRITRLTNGLTGELINENAARTVFDETGRKTDVYYDGTPRTDYYHERWTYDENGNMIQYAFYDVKNQLTDWETNTYDENGNLIENLSYTYTVWPALAAE